MVDLKRKRACILAVGTELTTGQITNRNAGWIASHLDALGIEVMMHLAVPDEHGAILDALRACEQTAGFLFVTGGLGPTSDDFTRKVVAEWAGETLQWHEPSWTHIETRLTRLGIPIAPANRQQCYFPSSAQVLANAQGTANGFALSVRGCHTWVMPGPPAEVAAVWESGKIEDHIRAAAPGLDQVRLFTWQCLGKSEAELGEIVEAALQGAEFKTGYRAHRPFVEIKVWVPESRLASFAPWQDKLEHALAPWIFTRQGEDLAKKLLHLLARDEDVEILDAATGGLLGERLAPLLRMTEFSAVADSLVLATEWHPAMTPDEWLGNTLAQSDPDSLTLAVSGIGPRGEFAVGLREGGTVHQETLKSPWSKPELIDRARRYVAEMTIARWAEWLETSVQ